MATEGGLDKETFHLLAGAAGLDTGESQRMEELYAYLQSVLPGLKALDKLDLSGVEPATVYIPPRE